ncbi:hypothetical protein TBLA_0I01180 [Henningerozyma blattae CBS 6284]|uniref:Aspartate aminotransferase n=1 Tax=Henningerozyma blattae (strain ATCC 34711 / CBS 6284 / DSM 70876 / NBRC 10599 / NRRL Y-10934 / UCD 77-7) TaxID=1071380 RepID=I2H8S6_HENB6|nr:hypothetical protein TBLA_0I01180 [Tetrapisispora blattae CBS 6284]CCH62778.1 hypothetical protein TBLA_0I01180 [Tetrapisispora blattae CBS 6284]
MTKMLSKKFPKPSTKCRFFASYMAKIPQAPPDRILGLVNQFMNDPNPSKVDLTVGVYRDNAGNVPTFKSVQNAQHLLHTVPSLRKDLSYLPIIGHPNYRNKVLNFLFHDGCPEIGPEIIYQDRVSFVQTLSGTGALSVTARFLSNFISDSIIIPQLSWANHANVFKNNGFRNISYYPYYSNEKIVLKDWLNHLINIQKTDREVTSNSKPSCILLHACCHNPTGLDPTKEQWDQILDTIYDLNLIPIIDMAYQGLESGDVLKDSYLLRKVLNKKRYKNWKNGIYLCQSFAKNMGLYGERVGSLSIILPETNSGNKSTSIRENIDSQLKQIIRSMYSSPPGYGARIVSLILSDKDLKDQWFLDVKEMVDRLNDVRYKLSQKLNWNSIIDLNQQHGMFYFTNLSPIQVERLKNQFAIYLTTDGRLSLSGINDLNVDYICNSILNVL